ncbi:2-amino-4-hydroxy-6-hydroxymethyldihydropteridine diphosphokinase [Synechococcales cyanobacterium C]|uniref:2-amino-4-hydroxy-6-hydroxymethyldihydropteridine diphosphokinase n=2 Tax=Petrachloros TaxID=2918834 RepID=A0A8K2A1S4_9CYAN|nr:2-amino-4-hydroxy-6-hydroxymethyldihydropteridine diphosphokinase [Petrachloros mirabilis ULC683]
MTQFPSLYQAGIGIGSNLGDSYQLVNTALLTLSQTPGIELLAQSRWYQTRPIGPPQPDYINGCALLRVRQDPVTLLGILHQIEVQYGRTRTRRWGPRSLDLDLLFYEDWILDSPQLTLPHPRLQERAFVLVPLAAICPTWVDPRSGQTLTQLLEAVDCTGVDLLPTAAQPTMPLFQEPPQILQQQLFYRCRKFSYEVNRLQLPNGSQGDWSCIRHPGGALAVPVTPQGQLVLLRQYRFALEGRLLEFPAGTVEQDEDPALTIRREIEEETGYRAHRWQVLGEFPLAPGYSDEIIYAFLAQDLEPLPVPPIQDEDEDMETVLMTPGELEAAIHSGEVIDAKSIASYFLARPFLDKM